MMPAAHISAAEMRRAFSERAALYGGWDCRLFRRTRFFAAASIVNAALVELCQSPRVTYRLYANGLRFLARTGASLQGLNIRIAQDIERDASAQSDWDSMLVRLEQLALERHLYQFQCAHQRSYLRVLQQVDWLLGALAFGVCPFSSRPSMEILSASVRHSCRELGRRPRFQRLSDRILIGRTLIARVHAFVTESGPFRAAVETPKCFFNTGKRL